MPNWCSNTLTIYGDEETRAAVMKKIEKGINGEGIFNEFIPSPEGFTPDKTYYRKGMEFPDRLQGRRLMNPSELIKYIRERSKAANTNLENDMIDNAMSHYAMLNGYDDNHIYDAELIETHLADNLYDWHVINYGIKWDIDEAYVNNEDGTLSVGFDSPWGPPLLAIQQISKQYPSLLFHMWYEESGCAIYGACVFANGEKVDKGKDFDWSEYEDNEDDERDEIEEKLYDEISSDAFCREAWYELRDYVDTETKQRINTHLGLKVRKLRVKATTHKCACGTEFKDASEECGECGDDESFERDCIECNLAFRPSKQHAYDKVCDECVSEKGKTQVFFTSEEMRGCGCSQDGKKICHEHYCYGCDQHEDDCECDHQCDEDDCKLCRRGIYCDCADKACPYCCRT